MEPGDLHRIRRIVRRAKGQSVGAICEEICRSFGWYRANGAPRERSVRDLLRRLQEQGMIDVPPECLKRSAPARGQRPESTQDREGARPRPWPEESEIPGKPRRQMYRLTASGRVQAARALERARASWLRPPQTLEA